MFWNHLTTQPTIGQRIPRQPSPNHANDPMLPNAETCTRVPRGFRGWESELEPSLPLWHIDSVTVSLSSRNYSSRITDHVIGNELWLWVVQAEMFWSAVVVIRRRFRCNENTDNSLQEVTTVRDTSLSLLVQAKFTSSSLIKLTLRWKLRCLPER